MGCNAIGFFRCYPDEQMLCLSRGSVKSNWNVLYHVRCNMAKRTMRTGRNSLSLNLILNASSSHRRRLWRTYSIPVSLEEQSSSGSLSQDELTSSNDPEDDRVSKSLSSGELKSLLVDSQRSKLMKKLSESNQQNRFLKRQLQVNENAMVTFKKELAVLEQEIKALVLLADELSKAGIPQAVREKILGQIKDVEAAQSKEVHVFWVGMAESVQVMGSFDGWSQGEHLSPEYTGSFTKFSATLLLRPGRYAIKFLVDGEWHLSSELPTIGEGLMENNLLVVEFCLASPGEIGARGRVK
ncbi:hypothetical protein KSS87_010779 [Heliosperma pusillum]|nr:hypothetical protein KSS87_010779 [Heliosperma pusillum]